MKRSFAAATAILAIGAAGSVPAASATTPIRFITTADGNITCAMIKGYKKKRHHGHVVPAFPGVARCDILQKSWTAPPPPKPCRVDYGFGLEVTWKGPGGYVCAGDTVRTPEAKILVNGQSITLGRLTCAILPAGVRCANNRSGHGFEISPAQAALF